MKLKEIFKEEENYIDLLKNKEIHMVTPAFIGLTRCSAYLEFGCNMKQPRQEVFVTQVNEKKEVGTLYPKYNLTLFPYRYRTSAFMTIDAKDYTNGKGYSDDDFKTFIKDILKAEIEYVKSKRLVIDVAGSLEDREKMRFFNLLREEVQKDKYKENDCIIEFKWN